MFIIFGVVMIALLVPSIGRGDISIWVALGSLVVGWFIGIFTSRIFHLSWDHNAEKVVGKIDRFGAIVLALYIVFEVLRNIAFESYIHIATPAAATFAFLAGAFIGRVFGIQGKIIRILNDKSI